MFGTLSPEIFSTHCNQPDLDEANLKAMAFFLIFLRADVVMQQ